HRCTRTTSYCKSGSAGRLGKLREPPVNDSTLADHYPINSSISMIKLRWHHIAILALMSWLVACTTATPQFPGARNDLAAAAPGDASRALSAPVSGECNASPDSSRSQYIIGYGSLMQDESRKRTSPQAGPAYP